MNVIEVITKRRKQACVYASSSPITTSMASVSIMGEEVPDLIPGGVNLETKFDMLFSTNNIPRRKIEIYTLENMTSHCCWCKCQLL